MMKKYTTHDCVKDVAKCFAMAIQKTIEDRGPIVAATRKLTFNRKTKIFDYGELTGEITNYDGRKTHFKGQEEYREKLELERARWHYFRSFREYGFTAKEWK